MKFIQNIYLTWRKGKGERRHIVGILRKNVTDGVRFDYLSEGVKNALKDGFAPYVDFPDLNKTYKESVLDIFGQRLVNTDRSDIQKYYDFWEIDPTFKEDKFYMLAYTQGMLSTDNFEFLAEFYPKKGLCFVSEISGLSILKLPHDAVKTDDELSWILEKGNKYDKHAVKVFKGQSEIGYIKLIHSKIFHKSFKGKLRIQVKSVDQNGSINRIFIRISF